jgi:hypothetical protein
MNTFFSIDLAKQHHAERLREAATARLVRRARTSQPSDPRLRIRLPRLRRRPVTYRAAPAS